LATATAAVSAGRLDAGEETAVLTSFKAAVYLPIVAAWADSCCITRPKRANRTVRLAPILISNAFIFCKVAAGLSKKVWKRFE
jgi:hypothetical protein